MRRLPETDLANAGPMGPEDQWTYLENMPRGRPPYSYAPVRLFGGDLLNVDWGPLAVQRPSWPKMEEAITRECRRTAWVTPNLLVGKGLYEFADAQQIRGTRLGLGNLPTGIPKVSLKYWLDIILNIGGEEVIAFIDPRRATRLNPEGRRFAFSLMHCATRARLDDLRHVRLAIIQFDDARTDARRPIVHLDTGVDLWGWEELAPMIHQAYRTWKQVLDQEVQEFPWEATGTDGQQGTLFRRR